MKTIFKTLCVAAAGVVPLSSMAQNYADGYMISQNLYMGSGRMAAMGSAFGALGADFSSLSINPAGIGTYRSSEFLFTPAVSFGKVSSWYEGTHTFDTKLRMNFNNVGYVYTGKTGNKSGLVSISFAFGYNRMNDLRNNFDIRGVSRYSSISDMFYGPGSGPGEDPFFNYRGRLADDTYMYISDSAMNNDPDHHCPISFEHVKKIERFGNKGETFFALGGNVSDFFYFGASVGYESFYLKETRSFTEYSNRPAGFVPSDVDIESIYFRETYSLDGGGFNFKAGFIVRPLPFLRAGASIQSPTGYTLTRRYGTYMETTWYVPDAQGHNAYYAYPNDGTTQLPDDELKFRFRTPMRITASAGVTLFKMLAADIDYEYVDYRQMLYRSKPDDALSDFSVQNNDIRNYMRPTQNVRLGTELKLGNFYLRGGAAYYMSPYIQETNNNKYVTANKDHYTLVYNAGIGFRQNNVFFDLGYSLYQMKESIFLYDALTLTEPANLTYVSNRVIATIGFKF